MDDRGGSFVAVRRISQGLERGNNTCHSSSAEVVAGSAAWLGRGLSCVCAQRRESDARPSFDLTPPQVSFILDQFKSNFISLMSLFHRENKLTGNHFHDQCYLHLLMPSFCCHLFFMCIEFVM
ncbi:hypothetical protein OIU76_006082 [Salix suchowensis]|nr:hypothetical protein OIU76_006082 [Salix suchowensis]